MRKILKKCFAIVMVLFIGLSCLTTAIVPTAQAAPLTGYDRGYVGGRGGEGKIYARGVDISEYQTDKVDFAALKKAGYSFVIIRSGFNERKDKYFEENYTKAKAAGLDVGVYFYSYADSVPKAEWEAGIFLEQIKGKTFEYPVYMDFEDKKMANIGTENAYKICTAFLDKVATAGYLTGLYGYANWLDESYSSSWVPTARICQKYECWIANYWDYTYTSNPKGVDYSQRYGMWQYSDRQSVVGLSLDANVCYKDYPSIVKKYGFNGYAARTDAVKDGTYTIVSSLDQNYGLAVTGDATDNGANVELRSDPCQVEIQRRTDGYYTLRFVHSDKYLDVQGSGTANGTNLCQWASATENNHQFYFVDNEDGTFGIVAKCNGLYVDVAASKMADGTNIQCYKGNGSGAQKWILKPVGGDNGGTDTTPPTATQPSTPPIGSDATTWDTDLPEPTSPDDTITLLPTEPAQDPQPEEPKDPDSDPSEDNDRNDTDDPGQPMDPGSSGGNSGGTAAKKQKAAKVLLGVAAGAPPVSGGICLALYLLKAKGILF